MLSGGYSVGGLAIVWSSLGGSTACGSASIYAGLKWSIEMFLSCP